MRTHFSLTPLSLLLLLVLSAITPVASAQRPDIFITPVPNARLSAVVHVERSLVQPNGTIVTLRLARASERV